MNVNELRDHILKYMTAEEALDKYLEGMIINYEKLKFDEGHEIHPIFIITLAAMDLNWQIAVEKNKKDIGGIMIGTKEYMKRNIK